MSAARRSIFLSYLAKYGDEGVSAKKLPKALGWNDNEVNAVLQKARIDNEIVDLPNGNVLLSDKLRGEIPVVDLGRPVRTERPI